ncbi:MAG: glycosyltransferase family 9 protein [Actinomycetota bacterium]|nr:glycosyltransferase family 9 protein [Actinomycetota bacterium]
MKTELLKKIDKIVGTPLCVLLGIFDKLTRPFRRKIDLKEAERILIIKTVALGDLVVALPAIKAIRETYPRAYIAMLVTPRVREIVEGNPHLDEIIYYDVLGKDRGIGGLFTLIKRLRAGKFDMVVELEHYYRFTTLLSYLSGAPVRVGFDLPNQGRSWLFTIKVPYPYHKHEVETFLEAAKAVGANVAEIKLEEIPTSREDKEFAEKFWGEYGIIDHDLVVGIHPGTSEIAKARRWMPERFAEVADGLARDYNARVVFTGAPADVELVDDIAGSMRTKPVVAVGKTTLKQFAELTRRFNLFISVDTGPMHIAAVMGTRVIGLFGPNTPEKWAPYGGGNISIYRKLDCSPCTKQYLGQVSKCRKDDCMRAITVEDVMEAARTMLR